MQKREHAKQSGAGGGATAPPVKRGRPLGSLTNSSAVSAIAAAADSAAPSSLLGPTFQVHSSFADQNHKRIVLALQSGLKSDLTWALNTLTVLAFKEKDEVRKDATPLAKIPGLLDSLLQIIDDWRDIAVPKEFSRNRRVRLLGANALVTGFGSEYDALASSDNPQSIAGTGSSATDSSQRMAARPRPTYWWFEEDGLFNLDDDGRAEKQQCAVAASNILRTFPLCLKTKSLWPSTAIA